MKSISLRRTLSAFYALAVVAFAILFLRGRWDEIVDNMASVGAGTIMLSLLCSVGALLAGMLVFRALLGGLGHTLPLAGAFRIYFVSQVGKYLPGSVWAAVAQVQLGKGYGVPSKTNLAGFFIGLTMSVAVGGTTGFVILSLLEPGKWLLPAALCLVGILGAFLLLPHWSSLIDRLPIFLRSRLPDRPPSLSALLQATAWLVVSWVLHGLQVAVLAHSLGLEAESLTLRSIGAFSLAYAAGILFIVAPAGAGVREAVMAAVLGGDDVGLLAAIVLLSRVVLLVADFALGLFGAGVAQRSPVEGDG